MLSSQLHGWSSVKAEMMGKPHVGAAYVKAPGRYERTQPCCCICGESAFSCHHVMPLGRGHAFELVTENGVWTLHSALFALCGSGTHGCHGLFHSGVLKAEWSWDHPEFRDAWWSGELLKLYGEHSPELYRFGCWTITDTRTGRSWELRP